MSYVHDICIILISIILVVCIVVVVIVGVVVRVSVVFVGASVGGAPSVDVDITVTPSVESVVSVPSVVLTVGGVTKISTYK